MSRFYWFIGIQSHSVIFVCFDCLQYQILISDREKFINSLLEQQCFNFKIKLHVLCVDALCEKNISGHKMCWGCVSQCCKEFLFDDFYQFLLV